METWVKGVGLRPGGKPQDEPPNPKAVARHRSIPTSRSRKQEQEQEAGSRSRKQEAGKYSTHRWQLDSPFIREYSWPLLPSSVGFSHPSIHPSVIRGPALPSVGFSFSSFFIRVIRGPFFLLLLLSSCFCLLSPAPVIGFQETQNCATVFRQQYPPNSPNSGLSTTPAPLPRRKTLPFHHTVLPKCNIACSTAVKRTTELGL
jgi:hypothetical protein